jgi:hypothetical protein
LKIYVSPEIENIIRKHCTATKKKKFFRSLFICCVKYLYPPYTDKRIEDSFVPMNMKLLRTLVRTRIKTIMENLVNLDILETDGIIWVRKVMDIR